MVSPQKIRILKKEFFLVLFALIFSLAAAEMIARKFYGFQTRPPTNIKFIPAEQPEQSYALPPNSSMVCLGIPFTTNELGLRDGPILPDSENLFRILCFGDSITFGSGVATEETYPNVLENTLQARAGEAAKIDIINAGVGGYNFQNILASANKLISVLHPNVVVYAFVENDLDDSFSPGPRGALVEMDPLKSPDAAFIEVWYGAKWKNRLSPKSFLFSTFALYRLFSRMINPYPMNKLPLLLGSGPETKQRWKLWEERLLKLKESCDGSGTRLVLYQVGMRNRSEVLYRKFKSICEQHAILFASTLPLFDHYTYSKSNSLRYDPHPNKEAHQLMAARLDCFLQGSGVLPEACIRKDKTDCSNDEEIDLNAERTIQLIADDMPAEIDLTNSEGIIGILGGIGLERRMARSCLFRLGGAGNKIAVESKALLGTPAEPQTLSVRIQDSSPSAPIPVNEEWSTVTFDIPFGMENQLIEVELIANGPVHIPTLAEREGGATPYSVEIRRIKRIHSSDSL